MVKLLKEQLHSVGIQGPILYHPIVMVVKDKPCCLYLMKINGDLDVKRQKVYQRS